MSEDAHTFPHAEVYGFRDRRVEVRATTRPPLDRLRLMYGRLFLDGRGADRPADATLDIVDQLDAEDELRIFDGARCYKVSRNTEYGHYSCQDMETLEFTSLGFCDPMLLVQNVFLQTLAMQAAEEHFFFHAGAVSRNGKCVLLAGTPHMGKTTLVLSLILAGWAFCSDEVACLSRATGEVFPFPRKINLREETLTRVNLDPALLTPSGVRPEEPEYAVDAEALPGVRISGPCRPAALVFLRGFGDRTRLDAMAPSNALFELAEFSIVPLKDPARFLFDLAAPLGELPCYGLVAGELGETLEAIGGLVGEGQK